MRIPFTEYMIVWVVRKRRKFLVCEHFSEAFEDWRTHEGEIRWLYPRLILIGYFRRGMEDFNGW